ncbi:hypothetical protein BpHYR1_040364 [Brachionus plicatilis]|uniref:Uncharacterized protein n=1 Tax=Brachionus plicatilis TaxID=10195 RepID=A0A3M7QXU6_BRAPC|nr:hypothetical protein BpHYR1_040364 [Brachionus plicatilis]
MSDSESSTTSILRPATQNQIYRIYLLALLVFNCYYSIVKYTKIICMIFINFRYDGIYHHSPA